MKGEDIYFAFRFLELKNLSRSSYANNERTKNDFKVVAANDKMTRLKSYRKKIDLKKKKLKQDA